MWIIKNLEALAIVDRLFGFISWVSSFGSSLSEWSLIVLILEWGYLGGGDVSELASLVEEIFFFLYVET